MLTNTRNRTQIPATQPAGPQSGHPSVWCPLPSVVGAPVSAAAGSAVCFWAAGPAESALGVVLVCVLRWLLGCALVCSLVEAWLAAGCGSASICIPRIPAKTASNPRVEVISCGIDRTVDA